jgi:hypothetical protein
VLPLGHEAFDAFRVSLGFKIEKTGYPDRRRALIKQMDLQVLVKHLQAAAGLEGQDVLHGSVHNAFDG